MSVRRTRHVMALAAVLLSCDLAASGELRPATRDRFVLVGAVTMSREPAPAGHQTPITFDARFVIRVRIERIISGVSPWAAGSDQVLLIHSPARMFGRYDLKGERFRFTFEVDPTPSSERDCRYCVTDLKPEKSDQSKAVQQCSGRSRRFAMELRR
jgi:hypothetical protein